MPSHSHSRFADERQEFCSRFKAARERKGITLAQIAQATKIPASLFAAFERNDLRRWPTGLFRRAFFREYARLLDVPLADACADFNRLFTDEGDGKCPKGAASPSDQTDDLRLVLDAGWHGPSPPVLSRLRTALIDAGIILLAAATLAWAAPIAPSAILVVVTMAYFSIGTVLFGETPAKWIIGKRASISSALTRAWSNQTGDTTLEQMEEPVRTWLSHVRRVGSTSAPQLRVRFKV